MLIMLGKRGTWSLPCWIWEMGSGLLIDAMMSCGSYVWYKEKERIPILETFHSCIYFALCLQTVHPFVRIESSSDTSPTWLSSWVSFPWPMAPPILSWPVWSRRIRCLGIKRKTWDWCTSGSFFVAWELRWHLVSTRNWSIHCNFPLGSTHVGLPSLKIDVSRVVCNFSTLDFGDGHKNADGAAAIEPGLLGFISSCYQLGSILAVPVAPWFNQKFGRRWSIMTGSIVMVIGAIIQGFSQHGELIQAIKFEWSNWHFCVQSPCISSLVWFLVLEFSFVLLQARLWSVNLAIQKSVRFWPRSLMHHILSDRFWPLLSLLRQLRYRMTGAGEFHLSCRFALLFCKLPQSCKFEGTWNPNFISRDWFYLVYSRKVPVGWQARTAMTRLSQSLCTITQKAITIHS